MVMRPTNQLKRVKDLEPGDRVRVNCIELEVGGIQDGKFYFYGQHPDNEEWKRKNPLKISANSRQWVEVIENSKRID